MQRHGVCRVVWRGRPHFCLAACPHRVRASLLPCKPHCANPPPCFPHTPCSAVERAGAGVGQMSRDDLNRALAGVALSRA